MAETSDPDDSDDSHDSTDDDAAGERATLMSAALVSGLHGVTDLATARELRERKAFYRAMREGERVPSIELTGATAWMRADALHDALAQTRRLSSAHLHYLLVVMARGHRPCGYVTADYNDATPPSLADWSRWLHGVNKQNIYRIREELHTWRLITYCQDDPMRVAINPVWETWDPCVFEARDAKPGGGRRPTADASRPSSPRKRAGERNLAGLRDTDNDGAGGGTDEAIVILEDDASSSSKITGCNLPRLLSSSSKITDDASEAAVDADSRAALNTLHLTSLDRDTLACIPSAAVVATPSPLAPDAPMAPLAPDVAGDEDPARATLPSPAPPKPAKALKVPKPQKSPKATKAPKPPRELSADHQYRVDLLAAIEQASGGIKPPNREREWAAAGKFFSRSAGAAPIEQVVACYTLERQRPHWDSDYLSLTALLSHFDAYVRSPTNYARAIERARAAANGVYDQPRETRETRTSETSNHRDSRGGNSHDGNTTPGAPASRRMAVAGQRGGSGSRASGGNSPPMGSPNRFAGYEQYASKPRPATNATPGAPGAPGASRDSQ